MSDLEKEMDLRTYLALDCRNALFHMIGLACTFTNAPMGFFWKDHSIRFPEIAEAVTASVWLGNTLPQLTTRSLTAISNHEGDNLTCAPTQCGPEPAFVRTPINEGPKLIQFQGVRRACRSERLGNRGGISGFFLAMPLELGA